MLADVLAMQTSNLAPLLLFGRFNGNDFNEGLAPFRHDEILPAFRDLIAEFGESRLRFKKAYRIHQLNLPVN